MPEMRPLHEARALLLQFQRSDLKAAHVVTGSLEFFASRDQAFSARGRIGPTAADESAASLTAPHLGTIEELASLGADVTRGTVVARLRVLDRVTELVADRAGTVAAHHAAEGDLVEYGQGIIAIA